MERYFNKIENNIVDELEKENSIVAYKAALEGIVLLKNDNCLPLNTKTLACYGPGVINTIKGGIGSGEVNERKSISIYDGLIRHNIVVSNLTWINDYKKEYDEKYSKFKKKSVGLKNGDDAFACIFQSPIGRLPTINDFKESNSDICMFVLTRQAGEGKDKRIENHDFDLNDNEIEFIKLLKKYYQKLIFVINSGSCLDISNVEKYCDCIIYYAMQGQNGGDALASLLIGKENFSGKLTDCWPYKYSDIPFYNSYSYLNNDLINQTYNESIYVGYRYFLTANIKPRYYFGYGLSYTNFDIKFIDLIKDKDEFKLKVIIKNVGNYKGKEVVQVYANCPSGKIIKNKEYQRLIGFAKTKNLNINESQELIIKFNAYDLSSFDINSHSYVLDKGKYAIRIGNSSLNTIVVKNIDVIEDIYLTKNNPITNSKYNFESLILKNKKIELAKESLILSKNDISYKKYNYNGYKEIKDPKVSEILNNLSIKEMIEVCVGEGISGMFKTSGIFCAGAVGRTTSKLFDKGLSNVNLSDGPAGLRILQQYCLHNSKTLKMVEPYYLFTFMSLLPKYLLKFITKKKNDKTYYQFATAFPVGTSLAQSFNTSLCEKVGKAISKEMSKYNITYFLGPALNIHKNPLCGRNFEYFSEDPLLTGKIASSIVKGIQSIDGNYAVIKHFAANNTEDNRNKSNSIIDERALREIYLKGFEITCIEGKAKSLMTSYNKLNDVYTPNSNELNINILRNEWGFKGVVMSDWLSTSNGLANNSLALKSGNDLIMPGGSYYKNQIYNDYKKGIISEKEIRRSASYIIKQILDSNINKKINIKK